MKPLFDFNGDGKMDMFEFMIATGTLDTNSSLNFNADDNNDSFENDSTDESDDLFDNQDDN